MKVLIVDDSKSSIRLYKHYLTSCGVRKEDLIAETNAQTALDMILNGDFSPDIIISDWNMKPMLGSEFFNGISEYIEKNKSVNFFVISSQDAKSIKMENLKLSIKVFRKPLNMDSFKKMLNG